MKKLQFSIEILKVAPVIDRISLTFIDCYAISRFKKSRFTNKKSLLTTLKLGVI